MLNSARPIKPIDPHEDLLKIGVPYSWLKGYADLDYSIARKNFHDLFDGGKDYYVSGGVGSGKTKLSCLLIKYRRENRQIVYRTDMLAMYTLFKTSDFIMPEKLVQPVTLIIEDLGDLSDRKTMLSVLEQVIKLRADRGKQTVITSLVPSIELPSISKVLAERIYSTFNGAELPPAKGVARADFNKRVTNASI